MRGLQWLKLVVTSAVLSTAVGSCGRVAERERFQIDSNTNWLRLCESSAECSGALVCLCGQCSQPCSESAECGLLPGASCGSASGSSCGDDDTGAGGLCLLDCSSASECAADFTCSSGACVPLPVALPPGDERAETAFVDAPPTAPQICPNDGQSLDMDQVFTTIADNLSGEDADDQVNFRYFSLANRLNAGLCDSSLDVERAGLVKALNSLSLAPTMEQPFDVDGNGVIYRIDLRDYEWDRPISIDGTNYDDVWEALVAHDLYSVPWVGDDVDDVVADTGTAFPVMFASAFGAVATEAPVYYGVIGMPENVDQFVANELEIDISANISALEVVRAGFSGAGLGLPASAFLAERHDIEVRNGYFWQVAEFGGGAARLFGDPLGQPTGERELVFTLGNGLLAFAFADAGGNRLPDSALLSTPGTRRALRSSFQRYASGVSVRDEVRPAMSSGTGHLTPDQVARIVEEYPDAAELTRLLAEDRGVYAEALNRANLDIDAADPISATHAAFAADVELNVAAGDLVVSPEFLEGNLGELGPELQSLASGRISRDDFSAFYVRSLCRLSIVLDNTPDPAACDAAASGL